MDFSTLLKGAADGLKKFDKDKKPSTAQPWNTWDAGDDDGWEDVADVAPIPEPAPPASTVPDASTVTSSNAPAFSSPSESPSGVPQKSPLASGSDPGPDTPTSKPTGNKDSSESPTNTAEIATLTAQLRAALDRASAAERKVIGLTRARETRSNEIDQNEARLNAMREEGEKLSVKIAEKEATVRNLKTTLKQRDAELENAEASISATGAKLEAAASRIRQLETSERAAIDARDAVEKRLREVEADARGKNSSSAALEAARAQLESLRKNQTSALETQAMRLNADKENALQDVESKAAAREEALNKTITELRAHLSQIVDNAGWREDQLRKENDELRMRAEQLEIRNEELAGALPNATRPLIRQVEALQAAVEERERAKQAVDRSHMERLRTAEAAAATARERERAAEERVSDILTRCAVLEEQVRIAQSEANRVNSEAARIQQDLAERESKWERDGEIAKLAAERLEKERDEAIKEVRKAQAAHMDALEASEEREKELRSKLASAETKIAMMTEQEVENRQRNKMGTSDILNKFSDGDSRKISGHLVHDAAEDVVEQGRLVDEEGNSVAGVYATERLSSSLRLRNGEVAALQAQLDNKEKATRALAEEVVSLTAKLEEVAKEHEEVPEVSKKLKELERRHSTLLELLGEREERIGELEADLTDVKAMYREQVTELLLRLERLNG